MANIGNYARDVVTGVPFTTGNATIYGPDGSTLATPALNGTTGRWEFIANGQPGKLTQEYIAAGQTKIIEGDATGQHGTFMAAEHERVMRLFGDGVIDGMLVTAPGGMNVLVGVGDLFNLGVLHPIYTPENVTIAAAHATLTRIDRVVSRLTRTGTFAGRVVLGVVQGTPAVSPVVAALTNDADTWEVEVAQVGVDAAAAAIVTGNITIALRPVASGPVSDGSITQAKLAKPSVGTPELFDAAVTIAKIAAGLTLPFLTPGLIATYWVSAYNVIGGAEGLFSSAQNTLYGSPIFIPKATTLTGVAVDRVSGSSVSATARLGLWSVGSNGLPSALHTDAGTVDISTDGVKSITGLSAPLVAGWYWASVALGSFSGTLGLEEVDPGTAGTRLIRSFLGNPSPGGTDPLWATQGVFVGTGALPGTFPAPGVSATGPNVWVQTSGS